MIALPAAQGVLGHVPPISRIGASSRAEAQELVHGLHGDGVLAAASPPEHSLVGEVWAHLEVQDPLLPCEPPSA